jgi:D-glycero-D-manno-heptose 1,7-bisphosphate phosphatase
MKAIFLDRDGVINRKAPEGEYISRWAEVQFLPGVFSAVLKLSQAGFKIFIVTNQRGIALRKVRRQDLEDIHLRMKERFLHRGTAIDGIYFCPHDIADNCSCRKPKPGLLQQAAHDYALDFASCWMIGDAPSDVQAGRAAGCHTARIVHAGVSVQNVPAADITAQDLLVASLRILQFSRKLL